MTRVCVVRRARTHARQHARSAHAQSVIRPPAPSPWRPSGCRAGPPASSWPAAPPRVRLRGRGGGRGPRGGAACSARWREARPPGEPSPALDAPRGAVLGRLQGGGIPGGSQRPEPGVPAPRDGGVQGLGGARAFPGRGGSHGPGSAAAAEGGWASWAGPARALRSPRRLRPLGAHRGPGGVGEGLSRRVGREMLGDRGPRALPSGGGAGRGRRGAPGCGFARALTQGRQGGSEQVRTLILSSALPRASPVSPRHRGE